MMSQYENELYKIFEENNRFANKYDIRVSAGITPPGDYRYIAMPSSYVERIVDLFEKMESDYEKKLKDAESRSRITERVKEFSNDTAAFYFPFGRE